jgi:nitrite reductase/ring-hydroxylating ferredoxin subunit
VPAQVSYNADLQQITCPWHNARFRTTGERINEVAPRDLVVFPVDFDPTSGEARIRFGGPR